MAWTRWLLPTPRRAQPHIYSDHQLQQLVTAAAKLQPAGSLRPQTYRTLFGLLASTGLRVSEALKLTKNDADLDRGILHIAQTKFRKSRLVLRQGRGVAV